MATYWAAKPGLQQANIYIEFSEVRQIGLREQKLYVKYCRNGVSIINIAIRNWVIGYASSLTNLRIQDDLVQ
jgi:hypothetical protein